METTTIQMGLDLGSATAKFVVIVPDRCDIRCIENKLTGYDIESTVRQDNLRILFSRLIPVGGDPIAIAKSILQKWLNVPVADPLNLYLTGSQTKGVSVKFGLPVLNEYLAIAHGVSFFYPDAQTILEIGGNVSRFIRLDHSNRGKEIAIIDYERNGECAAGTGSFIDQQAARLRFTVSEIGGMVASATETANIAGRCSVFAKSDMIHAQQRGYSPESIFKGLCEAVVRNFKGTVLRGKELTAPVVFVGGVAANKGVINAIRSICSLENLIIPSQFAHMSALGSALQAQENAISPSPKAPAILTNSGSSLSQGKQNPLNFSLVKFLGDKTHRSVKCRDNPINAYLGIDIGSVSSNFVLLDDDSRVLDEVYTETEGRPVRVVEREFSRWLEKWGDVVRICGVGTTGSGRELVGELVGADCVHDEITAHKTGADFISSTLFKENVDTIFEIGGQDSKYISIDGGVVVDFTMNEACAAGTGSFLEEQAKRMGISIKNEFADLALSSREPVVMGERCTVFMEKDVSSYLQQGKSKNDIAAGLSYAVVLNYLNRVVRGRKIGDKIFFQGGTAYNRAVAAAFATVLKKTVIVPPHNGVMGAIGAALLAKEQKQHNPLPTLFYGFDFSEIDFTIRHIRCNGCSNQCDVQEITVNGQKTYWGDKCSERFRKKKKQEQKAAIPNLIKLYKEFLFSDIPGKNGRQIKMGIPRTLYFYDQLPFWRAYFSAIGIQLVLSEPTNSAIIRQGQENSIAEPCFPVIVALGHISSLLERDVDYIFVPNVINAETEFPQTESWFCPWGQTLPLVFKNSRYLHPQVGKVLSPVVRFRDGKTYVEESLISMAKQLGISRKENRKAVDYAYSVQNGFRDEIAAQGINVLCQLEAQSEPAVVLLGRPYNIYDAGTSLNVAQKLYQLYGINIVPMDFLPLKHIDVSDIHPNMFWNYGKRILQASRYIGHHDHLHAIYFTNFKCGPDSYIKHFVRQALGQPYLTLQFDDHSNDAGIMTRCEAYLQSKNLLKKNMMTCSSQVEEV